MSADDRLIPNVRHSCAKLEEFDTQIEAVLRDALTVAFLEGGDCAFTAYQLEIGNGEKIDVGGIADGYVIAALPHVKAAILAAMAPPE